MPENCHAYPLWRWWKTRTLLSLAETSTAGNVTQPAGDMVQIFPNVLQSIQKPPDQWSKLGCTSD